MEVNLRVPAIEKLIDYTASGIGSVAGSMLAPWSARREAVALRISAQGEADSMRIIAEAQADARSFLVSPDSTVSGELDLAQTVNQRIQFQEEKRQRNIEAVVRRAADELGDKEVPDSDTDHDWAARFFGEIQDVSSEDMQVLWAKVLAGEVERPGSISIRTLGLLRSLNRPTAEQFCKLSPLCITIQDTESLEHEAESYTIILSLDHSMGSGSYRQPEFGIDYHSLNLLIEYGLIYDNYDSALWFEMPRSVADARKAIIKPLPLKFRYQNHSWLLSQRTDVAKVVFLPCLLLTQPGTELLQAAGDNANPEHTTKLIAFLEGTGLKMTRIEEIADKMMSIIQEEHTKEPSESHTQSLPLGKWLVENTPRGTNLEIPSRRETGRNIPFIDEADE